MRGPLERGGDVGTWERGRQRSCRPPSTLLADRSASANHHRSGCGASSGHGTPDGVRGSREEHALHVQYLLMPRDTLFDTRMQQAVRLAMTRDHLKEQFSY
jgi:hypothetical protein